MPVRADVSGSVLVFDEAHNIEDVCREGGSVDLSSSTMMEVRSCVW
jgi:Fanconi anemia group J protein